MREVLSVHGTSAISERLDAILAGLPSFWYTTRVIGEKRLPARFYRTSGGTEPVREWLKGLDASDRRIVGADIKEIEFDWPVGMPLCRPVGQRLWEVRSNISRGRIARVMFCIAGGEMVLLHGFVKKSQKTPRPDLELALRRKKEVGR